MKKGLSIFFLIYYLIFSFGFIVNKHFCRGELVSIEIMLPAESCCEDAGEEENTCCTSDQDIILLDDNQQNVQSVSMLQPVVAVIPITSIDYDESVMLFEKFNWISSADPPPPKKTSSYILNCSLTVYG